MKKKKELQDINYIFVFPSLDEVKKLKLFDDRGHWKSASSNPESHA